MRWVVLQGTEDCLYSTLQSLEEWQLMPQQRSRLRQPSSLLVATRTSCRSRAHTHTSTLDWMHFTAVGPHFVPTSMQTLKLIVPAGRNQGNTVHINKATTGPKYKCKYWSHGNHYGQVSLYIILYLNQGQMKYSMWLSMPRQEGFMPTCFKHTNASMFIHTCYMHAIKISIDKLLQTQ